MILLIIFGQNFLFYPILPELRFFQPLDLVVGFYSARIPVVFCLCYFFLKFHILDVAIFLFKSLGIAFFFSWSDRTFNA